ncbi:MAG: hypothetical protein K6G11_06860, partial [Lachnospiraceae bacterium]|nr:hypothetical protein [Lachnospiraceae bacterium]
MRKSKFISVLLSFSMVATGATFSQNLFGSDGVTVVQAEETTDGDVTPAEETTGEDVAGEDVKGEDTTATGEDV